jgi:DinB superfamily
MNGKDRCDECGFVWDTDASAESGAPVTAAIAEITTLLTAGYPGIRSRPHPTTWSPLEYGCHLRDVMLVMRERVILARRANGAVAPNMGRDDRVDYDGYADQDPADVARQLTDATAMYARVIGRLNEADWDRTLIHGNREPAERPLRWTAMHAYHEVVHHLLDIRRLLSERR